MVNEPNASDGESSKSVREGQEERSSPPKCQTDGDEVTKKSANNFIEFNSVRVYCDLDEDQLDSNQLDSETAGDLMNRLFDENGNVAVDQLSDHLDALLASLARTDGAGRLRLAERLLELVQSEVSPGVNLRSLMPIIIRLMHSDCCEEDDPKEDELYLQTRKYAIDALDELLKRDGEPEEQKVNELLNQLRYFHSDLHKLQLNKQQNENYNALNEHPGASPVNGFRPIDLIDLTIVEHPLDAICNLMKISFDEHYRNLICRLGGIEAISELLITEHRYHGFLLTSYEQLKHAKLKCDSVKIDEKWINANCLTLRRYTAMALTNLTFGDKQSKIQLSLDVGFLDALLAQLSCLFCEELIQVTSSVLRNLSWKASKISKAVLSELNSAGALMSCSMQIKKETTLKCILYALWNLSSHNMLNKQRICEVDGSIQYLISLLEYRSANSALTIVENTSGVMKNISAFLIKYDHLRKILRTNKCHELLLKHLRSTSLTIVCNSVGILWNVSKDNLTDQRILINLGAISMLKHLTFSKHKIIAIASKETLKNLLTSECLKNGQLDLEAISFRALSVDSLSASTGGRSTSGLLTQRKRMLVKRELKNSLKETRSISEGLAIGGNRNNQKSNYSPSPDLNCNQTGGDCCNSCERTSDDGQTKPTQYPCNHLHPTNGTSNGISSIKSLKRCEIVDVSHSTSDYFDLYGGIECSPPFAANRTIDSILQGLNDQKHLDTVLDNEFYLNTNMVSSVNFFPGYLPESTSKRSSMYSTISEPIMLYYDHNVEQFEFEKDLVNSEDVLEEEFRKLAINNDFTLYNSNNVFHAYPVIIQESNEFQEEDLELYKEIKEIDEKENGAQANGDDQLGDTAKQLSDTAKQLSDTPKQQQANDKANCKDRNEKSKLPVDRTRALNENRRKLNAQTPSNHPPPTRIPVPVQQSLKSQLKPRQQRSAARQPSGGNNNGKEISKAQNTRANQTNPVGISQTAAKKQATRSEALGGQKAGPEPRKPPAFRSMLPKLPSSSGLVKSKTMEKNMNIPASLPRSKSTTDYLCNRTYDLINEEDLDEINNDATENDVENDALTYNVEEKRNLTYILPSSESDRTLKNETETDERTLVYQLDKDDQKTDQNLQDLATYVQNFNGLENGQLVNDPDLDDDEATLNMNEINLSIENLNLIPGANLDDCSELTDSIFVENNIENTKPPTVYHQINYSVASSLNNSLFVSGELQSPRKDSSMDSASNASSSKSRLRSPKAKLFDLSCSPPTNTFTITKSSKQSRNKAQLDQSKDQALSTSGYQTSLNSSMLSQNSLIAIDKINPPSQFNQISGISSLNCSTNDCASTCESISSIGSDIYELSAKASLNSSLSGSPFRRPTKTSTPKHSRAASASKIAKPVTRVPTKSSQINYLGQSNQTAPVTPSKTDTFRKNKVSGMKKSNTSSISSTASSTKSDQQPQGNKTSNGGCKSAVPKATVANGNPQEHARKKTISTSKSMSKIGSVASEQPAKKASSKISSFGSSLWKRTVSSQQKSISSKVFKKKSTTTSSLDSGNGKKDRREPQMANGSASTPNSMTRSSTFEKLPTSNEEAIKFASSINANKNKIRPVELEGKLQKRPLYH